MWARRALMLMVVGSLMVAGAAEANGPHHHPHMRVSVGWGGWWGWPAWYGWSGWYGWPGWYAGAWAPAPAGSFAEPEIAAVDTDVSPEHARVFLDGQLIGSADDFDGHPGYLLLRPGNYALEFRLGGYRTATLQIETRAGRFFPVELELERVPGEPATPWYDRPERPATGSVYGPAPKAKAPEEPARPDATLRPELREPLEQSEPSTRSGRGAALDLRVEPANASVYLDGEFLGTADELARLDRGVAVNVGQHRIEVVAPSHAPRAVDVQVAAGERQQVVIELEASASPGGAGQRE